MDLVRSALDPATGPMEFSYGDGEPRTGNQMDRIPLERCTMFSPNSKFIVELPR